MKVLVGSTNQEKIDGARQAFNMYFDNVDVEGFSVESEVGIQPINAETLIGAKNRVKNLKEFAKKNNIKADYYVASEGGITNLLGEWIDIQCAVIESKDGLQSVGVSQGFQIPDKYIEEIKNTEFKIVMEKVFKDVEPDFKKRGIISLTKYKVSRTDLTKDAFVMALIKHINGEIWR